MSGYTEVVSDPSYAGQMIAFTYPHIGNYGSHPADIESSKIHCRGVILRDITKPSSWRASTTFDDFLKSNGIAGITGMDTRRLTRHIRQAGAMPGAFGTAPAGTLLEAARSEPPTSDVDLIEEVTAPHPYTTGSGPRRVVAYDFGIKATILRCLADIATVTVVPASTPAEVVLARNPDGVLLSNGPGDPKSATNCISTVRCLVGRVPVFGICLGFQLLALALGGRTFKMAFGHHGGNVPVRCQKTGAIEITSQNHNFAVESGSVPGVTETHVCLNDGVLEGFSVDQIAAFGVQYHPEAAPGPHDARHHFARFAYMMDRFRAAA